MRTGIDWEIRRNHGGEEERDWTLQEAEICEKIEEEIQVEL